MTKSFRPRRVDETWLLPLSVQDFVPAEHPAHLVRDIVREELDLGAILSACTEPRGFPPYHPGMVVALLLYAYSQGVYCSRRIARGCEERLDFHAVTALNRPDFRTINEFRRRHLAALGDLFVQVLTLCRRAGLVGLGHVAVDGTKLRANASKHKAMSHKRMLRAETELAAEVKGWLDRADAADAAEDAEHGPDRRGDECRLGWLTSSAGWLASALPVLNSKLRQGPRPARSRLPVLTRASRSMERRASGGVRSPRAHLARQNPRRSATSPIPKAGSCSGATGSSRATTAKSPWMASVRSSWRTA